MPSARERAAGSSLYHLEYLTPDGWVTGHRGVRLLDPQRYVDRLASNGKFGRATTLDDRLAPTGEVFAPADLPFDLRRRLVERCIASVDRAANPRGGAIAAAVSALGRGETVTLGDVVCRATRDARDEPVWRFVRARPRRSS